MVKKTSSIITLPLSLWNFYAFYTTIVGKQLDCKMLLKSTAILTEGSFSWCNWAIMMILWWFTQTRLFFGLFLDIIGMIQEL